MHPTRQSGFAAIEVVLIIVILGIIGGTGWYVWHSKQATDKTLGEASSSSGTIIPKKADCTGLNKTYTGILYTAPANTYSFCVPNGWKLYVVSDGSTAGSAVIGDTPGLVYQSSVKPKITQAGGSDGARAFSIFFNVSSEKPIAPYVAGDQAKAANVVGTLYGYTQTEEPADGAGSVPKGTKATDYYFEQGGKSLGVSYNIFLGDPDYTALIKAVVASIHFN